jgi:hypothetical protein
VFIAHLHEPADAKAPEALAAAMGEVAARDALPAGSAAADFARHAAEPRED